MLIIPFKPVIAFSCLNLLLSPPLPQLFLELLWFSLLISPNPGVPMII